MAKRQTKPSDPLEQERDKDAQRTADQAATARATAEQDDAPQALRGRLRPQPDRGGRVACWDPRANNGHGGYRKLPAIDAYAGLDAGVLTLRPESGPPHPVLDRQPPPPVKPPQHNPPGDGDGDGDED